MRVFFEGWRRRSGCATLVMACIFMAGWFRSFVILDSLAYSGSGRQYQIGSWDGYILWMSGVPVSDVELLNFKWDRMTFGPLIPESEISDVFMNSENWKPFVKWTIPYWSVALPLTLVSAWLLLTKPRKKPPITESLS